MDLYSSDAVDGAQSYEDILKRSDIQALILALPIPDQPGYIKKALAAGKHVLAEKPIGPDVASAQELIAYYRRVAAETRATLAIAENFRFIAGWNYGREEVSKLGRVTGFAVRLNWNMTLDNKYLKTSWRAKPQYQGGMLLDAGVHFTAALRRLLGQEHAVESLIAQTSLVQSYLPPVDSVNAVMKTKTGAVGSFNLSTGTTLQAFEFHIACEGGQVQAEGAKVVTIRGSGESAQKEEKVFDKTTGVKEEVQAVSLLLHTASLTSKPCRESEPALTLDDCSGPKPLRPGSPTRARAPSRPLPTWRCWKRCSGVANKTEPARRWNSSTTHSTPKSVAPNSNKKYSHDSKAGWKG